MTVLNVYVPAHDSPLRKTIAARSGIVGRLAATGPEAQRILIDYEGNLYGSQSLERYEMRLLHAAGRHVTLYPTVARMMVRPDEMIEVGTYDDADHQLTVTNPTELEEWCR